MPPSGERYGGVLGLPITFLTAREGTIAAHLAGESTYREEKLEQLLAQH
jgi:hypothetical protein